MNILLPFHNFTNRTYLYIQGPDQEKEHFQHLGSFHFSFPVTNPPGVATILTSNRTDGFSLFGDVMYVEAFSVNCIWLP